MTTPALTPKREAFCLAYVATGNASEAYRQTFNVSPTTKPETIAVSASKLLADPKVSPRVAALQTAAADKAVVDQAWVLQRLMRNADTAAASGDFAASNQALALLGKHLAMVTDKAEITTTIAAKMTISTVDRPPRETREEWSARRQREIAQCAGRA
jgi:phage terminase small subunit